MKEEKIKKSEKDKELLIPELYPSLRQIPLNRINKQSILSISKIALVHDKKKQDSLFSLLFKDNSSDLIKKRSHNLKELVISNQSYFPNELRFDKLQKKNTSKKTNLIEQITKKQSF